MRIICTLGLALSVWTGLACGDPSPLTPFYSRHRLIAGAGDPGFRDGNFVRAAFRAPMGLALSSDGSKLYVADSGNHAIRSIDLAQQNRVETVLGDGVEGDVDSLGATLPIRLSSPTDLLLTPDGARLYIYDRGNRKIKAWDFQQKALSTVFRLTARKDGAGGPLGLLLSAQQTHLTFIDSQEGCLYVGEIKSGALHRVLLDPMLAEGGAQLAYSGGRVRLLSTNRHTLYGFSFQGKELDSAVMESVTEGAQVQLKLPGLDTPPGLQGLTGMGAAPQHQGAMAWDADFACFRLFENPMGNVLGMQNSAGVPGPLTAAGMAKGFIKGPLALGYDPFRCMIYVSERGSNRVCAVRDDSQGVINHQLWFNHDYPKQKPVGVTRILMYGSSREFHSNEEGLTIDQYMSTQLELYLNLISALQGRGQQFEVIHDYFRGRAVGAGEIWCMEHPEIARDYHADYLLFPMDVDSLWWDIVAWNATETKDDVPLRTQDAEWAARSVKDRMASLGPVTRAMLDFCKKDPKACGGRITFPEGEIPSFNIEARTSMNFFSQPQLRGMALQVEGKIGAKIVAFCKQEKMRPIAFILPTKDYIGGSSNDLTGVVFNSSLAEEHAAALRAQGLPAFDLVDPIRIVDPALYPLWSHDDGHYRSTGIQWVAYMMAWKFMQETAPN